MREENKQSMLVAGVPLDRGTPVHVEHDDDVAMCVFEKERLKELHTPQCVMRRVHEMMHARHTTERRARRQYAGVRDIVAQITEDARMHSMYWPWRPGRTPDSIAGPCRDFIEQEYQRARNIANDPAKAPQGAWPMFGTRFRAVAAQYGLRNGGGDFYRLLLSSGMSDNEQQLATQAFDLIWKKKEGAAARLIESAFFPPPPPLPEIDLPNGKEGRGGKTPRNRTGKQPPMQVIELMHDVPITDASEGVRRVACGPRLDRRVIRRPVIPARCFLRRVPQEPGGTILIDASSSMGDWEQVTEWCERAPFATVAYYAGYDCGRGGWLYVYARNGYRASKIVPPDSRGNCVDGPALSWLMNEPGPRIFVTDRGFCGAPDSIAQTVRLESLERAGELVVRDYSKDEDD